MHVHNEMIADLANNGSFVGGSAARIVIGRDETALVRLWHEKRGESEPVELSGELIVQLGLASDGTKGCPERQGVQPLRLMYGVRHES